MGRTLLAGPVVEPIHLDEAKAHLRVDGSTEDALIGACIAAARAAAEHRTARALVAQQWRFTADGWPWDAVGERLVVPLSPLVDVAAITYLDADGVRQTLDPATYQVVPDELTGWVQPAWGESWPPVREQPDSVRLDAVLGHVARCTADATANTVTVSGWRTLAVGDVLRLGNSGGAMPGGLAPLTDYYVQSVVSAGTYKLAATSGGAAIDITGTGTGTHYVGELPEALRAWLLLAIGTLYQNRETLARGQQVELPGGFWDHLLDPYRVIRFA
ncbi:MAG: head-tail connector protein [Anaerolineae bacterium]